MTDVEIAPVAKQAVDLSTEIFADNLRLAFVGGSYARGTHRPTSDVDVFVLLGRPDDAAERAFALALRNLHERSDLSFEHCGEVFDEHTLDELLVATEWIVGRLPGIQQMACYQADCLLSVFRKGDVVFKFLADPKICVIGDADCLAKLERRAEQFFARFPMRRIQRLKGRLELPVGSRQAVVLETLQERLESNEDWTDTPVGIGLQRWLGSLDLPPLDQPQGSMPLLVTWPRRPESSCPLSDHAEHTGASRVLRLQCLAHRTATRQAPGEEPS